MKNRLDDPCVFKYHFTNITLGMRAKIGIAFLSISLIASFGLSSNQAFGGVTVPPPPTTCQGCDAQLAFCIANSVLPLLQCQGQFADCQAQLCPAVGGNMIQIETTSVLAAGAQYTAAWMIPVIVSGIGFAIVIARKF